MMAAGLILVIGILGPLFARCDFNSIFLVLSMLSIAAVAILIISRRVPERYYPLYILVISVALQYNRTLSSLNLGGLDSYYELYFANLVRSTGFWDPSYTVLYSAIKDYTAMLSVTILPNVYSILLNVDNVWVFKIVWPIIFAFVPLGLYQIYKTQTKLSNTSAFLATFFFMSFFVFYMVLPVCTRQEIALLFFVLTVMVIMNKGLQGPKGSALLILFISSMAVSHYATSYIFVFYLGLLVIGCALIRSKNRQGRGQPLTTIFVLAVVISFAWYIFASGGAAYEALIGVGNQVAGSLSTMYSTPVNPYLTNATSVNLVGASFTQQLSHYWQLLTEVLIVTGLAFATWQRRKTSKMSPQLHLLSLASFVMLFIVIVLPPISASFNTERAYVYALLFLAPCCVFGAEAIVDFTSDRLHLKAGTAIKLVSVALLVVLVPFFLLSTYTISEIAERPSNYAFLSSANHGDLSILYPNNTVWSYLAEITPPNPDVYESRWLGGATDGSLVYSDWITAPQLSGYGNISPNSVIFFGGANLYWPIHHAYVYFGFTNHHGNLAPSGSSGTVPIASVPALTTGKADRIYSNGLDEVYYYP